MSNDSMRAWLALSFVERIGPIQFHGLRQHFGTVEAALAASSSQLRACGCSDSVITGIQQPDWSRVEATLNGLAQHRVQLLCYSDVAYPSLLRQLVDAPPLLYVRGDPAILSRPQLAIVGSRHATPIAEQNAFQFAAAMTKQGWCITSGMAFGIDAAAHRGALDSQGGTIAVAGTGIDRVYPSAHRDLAHRIVTHGAIVSEFPIGTPPLAGNFPRRNRLISGLCQGVLVVEAALQSGSLITAQHALDQGRDVFALPGSIHNTNAKGCHALIRQGAKLVDSLQHILEELGGTFAENSAAYVPIETAQTSAEESPNLLPILAAVDEAPTTVDSILQRTGLTPDAVCSILLLLELQGKVKMTAAGQYCRVHYEGAQ